MPVAPIAGKARSFYAKDRSNLAGADFGHQSLEAGSFDQPGARTPEIVIDDHDVAKAEAAGSIRQTVLPQLAFMVMEDLPMEDWRT
jgi:hypothetical protein